MLRRFFLFALLMLGSSAEARTLSGCPWANATGNGTTGIVDANAVYWSSLMPNNVLPGTVIQVYASYPQLRFFNFTVYGGGKTIDYLADANLYPVEGGTPNPDPSALPYSNNYTDHYLITIKFEDVPAVREPNTLYAGSATSENRLLLMRNYLPNAGVDSKGGVDLPELTQINPDGSTLRYDISSPNLGCPVLAWIDSILLDLKPPIPGVANKNAPFLILTPAGYNYGGGLFPPYSNFDSGYGSLLSAPTLGDILLIRNKMDATPTPQSTIDPSQMQARYFSICAYLANTQLDLGCLTDAQLVTQFDGYNTTVISQANARPPLADPDDGYNWMPWYDTSNRILFIVRQELPNPDFAGNYQVAGAAANPIAALGDWAPQATYCDTQTFNTYASSGGAAVFAACQAAKAAPKQAENALKKSRRNRS